MITPASPMRKRSSPGRQTARSRIVRSASGPAVGECVANTREQSHTGLRRPAAGLSWPQEMSRSRPTTTAGEVDLKRSRERTTLRRDGDVDDGPSLLDVDLIKVVSSARMSPPVTSYLIGDAEQAQVCLLAKRAGARSGATGSTSVSP